MTPILETKNLTRLYAPGRGITGLDLAVYPGEIFGYLGPNGAGKTTTIRLMMGFIRPQKGSVSIFGKKASPPRADQRRRIGYLPGDLAFPEHFTGDQALKFYEKLSSAEPIHREWLCRELDFSAQDRARRVKTYSKGMRQKLGLIQAMQHDPAFMVFDEPTSGLDPIVQEHLFDVLRELRDRGRTIFFSSHILSEIERLCDRVGVVREGHLILNTTLHELFAGAERLLWVKMAGAADMDSPVAGAGSIPSIAKARFLRSEPGGWLVYRVAPGDSRRLLAELAVLNPLDFMFEPAVEETFLRLYGVQSYSGRAKQNGSTEGQAP